MFNCECTRNIYKIERNNKLKIIYKLNLNYNNLPLIAQLYNSLTREKLNSRTLDFVSVDDVQLLTNSTQLRTWAVGPTLF